MTLLRPLPRSLTRPASFLVLVAWLAQMGVLVRHTYQRASATLATDLAAYGASASWKGVYYRGDKIGYLVSQTSATADGFELREDGQLQMVLLGATSAARLHTSARVGRDFALRDFAFSLDPGTGPLQVRGRLEGRRLELTVSTPSGAPRREVRELAEPPTLSLNLTRRLASAGLAPGMRREFMLFDPATMRNAPMQVEVEKREVVQAAGRPVPAFRTRMSFGGISSTSWVTDTGEVVREESPLGLIVVKESRERALALAVPGDIQADMLEAAAVVPIASRRIDDPSLVSQLRLRLDGVEVSGADLEGAGQTRDGRTFTIRDTRESRPSALDASARDYLAPEALIESDAPEIRAEAEKAVGGALEPRLRAERLVRYVNALLEKKPTVSLPSAREVLRTRVGDCNEHTALYVAMARSIGLPARIAVGLVYMRGAFYYHAWPEVYVTEGREGLWLPVDPTLNQFPADATHLRLARGGLERQAAILPMIGRARITILDVELEPGATPVLVGRPLQDMRPPEIDLPSRRQSGCWSTPAS